MSDVKQLHEDFSLMCDGSFNLYMSDVKQVLKTAAIIVGWRGVFCRPQKFVDKNGILRNKNYIKPYQIPYLSDCRCRLFS